MPLLNFAAKVQLFFEYAAEILLFSVEYDKNSKIKQVLFAYLDFFS